MPRRAAEKKRASLSLSRRAEGVNLLEAASGIGNRLILGKEFADIIYDGDDDNDRGTGHPDQKDDDERMRKKVCERLEHPTIVAVYRVGFYLGQRRIVVTRRTETDRLSL